MLTSKLLQRGQLEHGRKPARLQIQGRARSRLAVAWSSRPYVNPRQKALYLCPHGATDQTVIRIEATPQRYSQEDSISQQKTDSNARPIPDCVMKHRLREQNNDGAGSGGQQ